MELTKIKKVGEGINKVYLMYDKTTNKNYAAKKIKIKDDGLPDFLLMEADILRNISHENIIKLIGIDFIGNNAYLILPYLPRTLNNWWKSNKIRPKTVVREFIRQLLSAVDYLHQRGYVHRDIKSHNIMLDENDQIKLIDFGLSQRIFTAPAYRNYEIQTPCYRAPEIICGEKRYGYAIDIWSIGCILGELWRGGYLFLRETNWDMLNAICSLLGKPTRDGWPEICDYDYDHMPQYPPQNLADYFHLANLDTADLELFTGLLKINPCKRFTTQQALAHLRSEYGCNTVSNNIILQNHELANTTALNDHKQPNNYEPLGIAPSQELLNANWHHLLNEEQAIEFSSKFSKNILEWLLRLTERMDKSAHTLIRTIYLLARIIDNVNGYSQAKLALTCLYIIDKMCETRYDDPNTYLRQIHIPYREFLQIEQDIFDNSGYRPLTITPFGFLKIYTELEPIKGNAKLVILQLIVIASMFNLDVFKYKPSIIAASALYLYREYQLCENELYTFTGYSLDDLSACITEMEISINDVIKRGIFEKIKKYDSIISYYKNE